MSGTHHFGGCNSADSLGQQRDQPPSPDRTFLDPAHLVAPKTNEALDLHGFVRLNESIHGAQIYVLHS